MSAMPTAASFVGLELSDLALRLWAWGFRLARGGRFQASLGSQSLTLSAVKAIGPPYQESW